MNIDLVLKQEWTEQEQGELGHVCEYAWDDVNNMELPIEKVREAREKEMKYMKGETFKVVKKSEAYRVTGKVPISTKWVDTDKSHGNGEIFEKVKVGSTRLQFERRTRSRGPFQCDAPVGTHQVCDITTSNWTR